MDGVDAKINKMHKLKVYAGPEELEFRKIRVRVPMSS
ncbi:hypothetical protein NTE_03169 [Candidatus Nitrososphaera evergladensis SR1]|jgi:hypothetical protein|uniref:Uncharacterized protein n=1 Tax=Candidatus Nitrososphaera evergladensis SR1 TaxID=1459636 RepID=A0A075MU68_9ARCH|nr:hypothetical protein NTE_03169 [Candidatus Nitrososphaera evergladensis SR1]